MMESRKRPNLEDSGRSVTKKRALSSQTGSPMHANGIVESPNNEPQDEDELEHFRKGAIFRRMKHYSREHMRGLNRIRELELNKSSREAEFAAMDACWTQLVDSINLLVKLDDLTVAITDTEDNLDLTPYATANAPSELIEFLRNRMRTTQKLVTTFVKLAGNARPPSSEELLRKCQKAQSECISLRSELKVTRAKLDDTLELRAKCHNELIAAEAKADRLRSRTVQALEHRSQEKEDAPKEEEIEEEKPLSPHAPTSPLTNGIHKPDEGVDDVSKELLESRDIKIAELERENAVLRDQVNFMRNEISQLPEDTITSTPYYKVLLEHASKIQHGLTTSNNELTSIREELTELTASRTTWEAGILASASKEVEETKLVLKKRDDENSRLRQQRDQQAAELNERKAKANVKQAHADEYKTLAESRSERIAVLDSEVKRLRTRLAAINGDEDLLSFLSKDKQNTMAYVDDLKARLADSETRCNALNAALSRLQGQVPDVAAHIAAESDARRELEQAQHRLVKYESILGPHASLTLETNILVRQLESKEEELRVMKLRDSEREQAEAALYAELDKLSAAWEALDRQVKSKVFDLNSMEERLTKHGLDKAKAENKFYSAMRDKEAVETERKNLVRNLEKQTKVTENLSKSEKSLNAMVGSLEKEAAGVKKTLLSYKIKVDIVEKETVEWKTRAESESKRVTDIREQLTEREKFVGEKNIEINKLKEELAKAKRDAEKTAARTKSLGSGSGSTTDKESELQNEVDKCMRLLKCSTCQNAMRSTVITKCMHSFCKSCVDARISHRQRKCPACNLAFSQSDVQTLFFQ